MCGDSYTTALVSEKVAASVVFVAAMFMSVMDSSRAADGRDVRKVPRAARPRSDRMAGWIPREVSRTSAGIASWPG